MFDLLENFQLPDKTTDNILPPLYFDRRKTFYLNDDIKKPCRAAGFLPYRIKNGHLEFLLIKRQWYEDFGGKTDFRDDDIFATLFREAYEESNCIFKKEEMKKLQGRYFYVPECKYFILIAQLNGEKYSPEIFGDIEYHDRISRTVEWVNSDIFLQTHFVENFLHPRLRKKIVLKIIIYLHFHVKELRELIS